jgi:hypothetical protein
MPQRQYRRTLKGFFRFNASDTRLHRPPPPYPPHHPYQSPSSALLQAPPPINNNSSSSTTITSPKLQFTIHELMTYLSHVKNADLNDDAHALRLAMHPPTHKFVLAQLYNDLLPPVSSC